MKDHLTNLLLEAQSRYPGCFEQIDSLRKRSAGDWPEYCFLPLGFVVDIVTGDKSITGQDILERGADVARLAALSAWRATQRIYRFGDALLGELNHTPLADVPSEIFRQLPDWCIYIPSIDRPLKGCFVHLQASEHGEELRLLFDFGGGLDNLFPITVHFFEETVKECVESQIEEAKRELRLLRKEACDRSKAFTGDRERMPVAIKRLPQVASQVLYLCSVDADYSKPTSLMERSRVQECITPAKPEEIEVGMTLPAVPEDSININVNRGVCHVCSPRWHYSWAVRHHAWVAPKDKAELTLKWEPAILDDRETDLPTTMGKSEKHLD